MTTSELAYPDTLVPNAASARRLSSSRFTASHALSTLASLRLTVVLFALAIFLVFAGTLAQVDHGIWEVVNHAYFRVWIARVDFLAFERLVQMFYPVEWPLTGGFYFPGGKLIGGLLLVNLLSAHAVRFKVAADGSRLRGGLAVVALGVLVTALVIRSGMNDTLESELSPAFCNGLWQSLRATLAGFALAGGYLLVLSFGRRRAEWCLLLSIDLLIGAVAVWLFLRPDVRLDDSGLRILWQLVKGLAAGGIMLTGCVMAFRKRAGIVLLHGGVALMMCSELWTGLTANEAQMRITEGETTNFTSDIRTTELAVIDHSNPDHDRVTVIPASLLIDHVGAIDRIEDADLPVTIQVLRWLANSDLRVAAPGGANAATAGVGLHYLAEEARTGSGVGNDATVDQPAAYLELFSKATGESLGTFLVAAALPEQPIGVGAPTCDLALRFKRSYYPYTLTLKDFRFDRYVGTNTPKNYSSLVQLKDPAQNVDRDVLIWMNNPLRYAGDTFYQSSFDQATEQTTVLQVVTNPGWMAPYVACMLVATGMLAHFGMLLVRFSRRRAEEAARLPSARQHAGKRRSSRQHAGDSTAWTAFTNWFPALVVIVFALYVAGKTRMPQSAPSQMQVYEFAKLPLAYQGRIKPYDTVARNALQILSGRQEVIVEQGTGRAKLPAIRWLLDAISGTSTASDHRVFRIENLELLDTLGLKPREGSFRYSLNDFREKLDELQKQIELADAQPVSKRSLYQKEVLRLATKLNSYTLLIQSFRLPELTTDQAKLTENIPQIQLAIERLRTVEALHSVPPREPSGRWTPLVEAEFAALHDRASNQPVNPATVALSTMLDAYARNDATTFNKQLADYRHVLADYENSLAANANQLNEAGVKKAEVLSQRKINFEVFYNHFSPFYYAAVLYFLAFVLAAAAWLAWTEPLRRASMWLLAFTFAIHTFALVARIDISGRPPVTNLYSSAVFIGWACVLLAIVFEQIYRLGLGNIVASVIGFLTLLVAHFLSLDGDTFIVLQAVLDTQFWLATHVVCITLGYATTFLAGALGVLYVFLAHVLHVLDDDERRQLTRMIYGTLCFAIFFSFVGTVLGGLWADDSWGRFWGWDPKENGALIIVLYNALVLHARWGGLVAGRGLALLAVGGNIVTTWSWFGVNALGVGLHAYGANDSSTAMWLLTFSVSQLALILLGALPRQWYASLSALRSRVALN
jgi:ABC-type transport system involved in cytochrome c biogenesis permease subunit